MCSTLCFVSTFLTGVAVAFGLPCATMKVQYSMFCIIFLTGVAISTGLSSATMYTTPCSDSTFPKGAATALSLTCATTDVHYAMFCIYLSDRCCGGLRSDLCYRECAVCQVLYVPFEQVLRRL